MQLNLDELPEEVRGQFGSGLLQLFYCANTDKRCEVMNEAYLPFNEGTIVRRVTPSGDGQQDVPSPVRDPFPPRRIVDWEPIDDYPDLIEADDLGVELSEEEEKDYQLNVEGDKLAG